MASIAAFVYFWSSAYEVSGCCTTDTLYPSFMSIFATASQPEPSAKAPCTRTTFLICCFTIILLCSKDPLRRYLKTPDSADSTVGWKLTKGAMDGQYQAESQAHRHNLGMS